MTQLAPLAIVPGAAMAIGGPLLTVTAVGVPPVAVGVAVVVLATGVSAALWQGARLARSRGRSR